MAELKVEPASYQPLPSFKPRRGLVRRVSKEVLAEMVDQIEVEDWKYSRPKHIPEGVKELMHACGRREYEKDGVWYLDQCSAHKMETDSLIESLGKETTKE